MKVFTLLIKEILRVSLTLKSLTKQILLLKLPIHPYPGRLA